MKGRKYTVGSASGKETVVCPTFGENLRFFFRYQTGFMYLRYFMWNFAGRQNDIQGNGNNIHGNWISGIKFLDKMRLGDQDNLPEDLKTNPGRNTLFSAAASDRHPWDPLAVQKRQEWIFPGVCLLLHDRNCNNILP